jgi:hypothetical protein
MFFKFNELIKAFLDLKGKIPFAVGKATRIGRITARTGKTTPCLSSRLRQSISG